MRATYLSWIALAVVASSHAQADTSDDLPYQTLEVCLSENFVWPENCLNAVYRSCMGSTWGSISDANLARETCWTAEKQAWEMAISVSRWRLEANMSPTAFDAFLEAIDDIAIDGKASDRFVDQFLDRDNPLDRSYIARTEAIAARNLGLQFLNYQFYLRDGFLEELPEVNE
ncbi:hypothetical protein [Yoonia sp. SDW83-1]|uniref:hypothetical protein n=1 Tax=Yoonia sp. SDW83-1 TaxID=3366945 RepID=UPI00398C525D